MGFDPRSFTKEALQAAGLQRVNGRIRTLLRPSLSGYFWLWLDGNPPTATHHDKKIKRITNGAGKTHATLANAPALVEAWNWYLERIPERDCLVPLRPPIVLAAHFRWQLPLSVDEWPEYSAYGQNHIQKPDLDNSMKVLKDALALRGYLVDDSHVSKDGGSDKRWCEPNQRPGILIMARTLIDKEDDGRLICPHPEDAAGTVWPIRPGGLPDTTGGRTDRYGRPLLDHRYTPPVATVTTSGGRLHTHNKPKNGSHSQPEPQLDPPTTDRTSKNGHKAALQTRKRRGS